MDIVYLLAAGALWAVALGLAHGCDRLRPHRAAP